MFFCYRVFFHGHWQFTGEQRKEDAIVVPIQRFYPFKSIYTFATLYLRWFSWWLQAAYTDLSLGISIWLNINSGLFSVFLILNLITLIYHRKASFELASTIITEILANRLNKWSSHTMVIKIVTLWLERP